MLKISTWQKAEASQNMAAAACGADGLMIEVHNDPAKALCDGAQSLTPQQFDTVCKQVKSIREAMV
jgi:3-deoxy-7-phosphoheptulonate synthase